MGLPDHLSDAVNDYAFVKEAVGADADRTALYLRRRVAAVAFVPGLLLVMLIGGWTHSGVLAVAGLAVLVGATALAIFLPSKNA